MADVFISYAKEDIAYVEKIVALLGTRELSLWWDRDIIAGDEFHDIIEAELNAARKVIVLWSRNSVASLFVRDEATSALEQRKILPIVIDDCTAPLGFRSVHYLKASDPSEIEEEILKALGLPPKPLADDSGAEAGSKARESQRGSDLRYNLMITLSEAFTGKQASIRVPETVPCEICSGTGRLEDGSTRCRTCSGTGSREKERALHFSIPSGVDEGNRIRLANEGEAGRYGGPPGDLYIFLAVEPHPFFGRDETNLSARLPVSENVARTGGRIKLPLVDGSWISLSIPAGTKSGSRFRIKGKGMPDLRSRARGDMYVEIEAAANLAAHQRVLLEEIEKDNRSETSPDLAAFFSRVQAFFGAPDT